MPLIQIGQLAWDTAPTPDRASQDRARPDRSRQALDRARAEVALLARRVADEIESANGRDLEAGANPGRLFVLLRALPERELVHLTGPRDLENLMPLAPDDQIEFLICAHIASSLLASDAGYASTLVRAGALANVIVSATRDSGWSASMDFACEYAVTGALRHTDRQAVHLGTVLAYPKGRA